MAINKMKLTQLASKGSRSQEKIAQDAPAEYPGNSEKALPGNELVVNVTADWKVRIGREWNASLVNSSIVPSRIKEDLCSRLSTQLFQTGKITLTTAETVLNQGMAFWKQLLEKVPEENRRLYVLDVDEYMHVSDYRSLASMVEELVIITERWTDVVAKASVFQHVEYIIMDDCDDYDVESSDSEECEDYAPIDYKKVFALIDKADPHHRGITVYSQSEFLNNDVLRIPELVQQVRVNIAPILTGDARVPSAFVCSNEGDEEDEGLAPSPVLLSSPQVEISMGGSSGVFTLCYQNVT